MIKPALAAALVALALGGCDTLDATPKPARAPLDLSLTGRCPAPTEIPDRDLTEREVARLWGLDRLALADCRRRFAATVSIIETRDAALAGGK